MNKFAVLLLCALMSPLGAYAAHTPTPAAKAALERAAALDKEKKAKEALAAYIEAVEADPSYVDPHDALLEFRFQWSRAASQNKDLKPQSDEINATLDTKYAEWEKRYPDGVGVLYGVGTRLYAKEDPDAKPYLVKVAARDPSIAKVYSMLSGDAERWGDSKAALDYMRKASELEPQNPDYAFYYASKLGDVDYAQWEAASLSVAKRFPAHERGAQAYYWLAQRAKSDARRIELLEQQHKQFPAGKFRWTDSASPDLFEAYLRTDPARAVKFAQELQGSAQGAKEWEGRAALAQSYVEATKLIASGKAAEASALLDKLTPDRYSSNGAMLLRLKAQVMAASGRTQEAYDSLLQRQAKTPDDETLAAMVRMGQGLNKSPAQVSADIRTAFTAAAKPAPAFDLGLYTSDGTVSLEKLRGKVVFVTFWFPGCGPCRGEFPHFESVVRQFKGKDLVYLGINGIRDQDDYVMPFMKGTEYSFIPLKGTEAVTGPEGYKVRGYPSNFLIDREGRIVYSNFRTSDSEASQRELKRMIESLL